MPASTATQLLDSLGFVVDSRAGQLNMGDTMRKGRHGRSRETSYLAICSESGFVIEDRMLNQA